MPRFVAYRNNLKQRARSLRAEGTPAERRLWREFLSRLPEKFTRQKPLGRFIADFYCSSGRLVVEIDGDSHYSDQAESYDDARTAWLQSQGIRVLRFTNPEVMEDFEAVCGVVLGALRS